MSWPECRVVLLGDRLVGRSSILRWWCQRIFFDEPLIEDSYRKVIELPDKTEWMVLVEEPRILSPSNDTPGDRFCFGQSFARADFVVLLFAIDNRKSWEKIPELIEQIKQNLPPDHLPPHALLVGTKYDRREQRQVSVEEAKQSASEWGCMHYRECSVKNHHQVDEIFLFCAETTQQDRLRTKNETEPRMEDGKCGVM